MLVEIQPQLQYFYKKKHGWEPIHKEYKTNKSSRTQVAKKHNNQDITNTLIK